MTTTPATPEIAPLRVRLFSDGAMVIDTEATPLDVHSEEDPDVFTLDGAMAAGLPVFLKSLAKGK
jgi:hypothetical protein